MGLANIVNATTGYSDELTVSRNFKAGSQSQFLWAYCYGVRQAVTILIPHNFFNLLCFFSVSQISAFFNKLFYDCIVNGLMNYQVTIAGTAATEIGALRNTSVLSCFMLTLRSIAGIINDDG